ncbi:MAG: hypothetical protein FJX71_03100 [Alphaproteobacteria bacterium]|nr:hypothetical protein [Alphaproteobacteria bacterium]
MLLLWYSIIGIYLGLALLHPTYAAVGVQNNPPTESPPLKASVAKSSLVKPSTAKAKKTAVGKKTNPQPQKEVALSQPKPIPTSLKTLSGKSLIIDARRLKGHKLTETIRFIQNHPNTRFKLINMTIDSSFIIPLMEGLKNAHALDQIRDISFVMLPTANGQILNEKDFIGKVLPYLNGLEGIELSCLGVTDKVVEAIAQKLPHLKRFSGFGDGISDVTVTTFVKLVPDITKIHLINTRLTSRGLRVLVTQFPKLRNLGISGQNLKDNDFLILREGGSNLRAFSMIGQTFKDINTIPVLLESMPNLHSLDLSESNVTNNVGKAIAENLRKLKVLNISETQITFEGIKSIVDHQDLTALRIDNLKGIGNEELTYIANSQPGLKKFHFSGANLSDTSIINILLKLPKLTDVTFKPADGSKWSLSDAVVEAIIQKKTPLQYLHIQHERFQDALRMKLEKEISKLIIEYIV